MSDEVKKVHLGEGVLKPGIRPIKVYLDENGEYWLCDADVDETIDLKEQACWRCSEVPFTRND